LATATTRHDEGVHPHLYPAPVGAGTAPSSRSGGAPGCPGGAWRNSGVVFARSGRRGMGVPPQSWSGRAQTILLFRNGVGGTGAIAVAASSASPVTDGPGMLPGPGCMPLARSGSAAGRPAGRSGPADPRGGITGLLPAAGNVASLTPSPTQRDPRHRDWPPSTPHGRARTNSPALGQPRWRASRRPKGPGPVQPHDNHPARETHRSGPPDWDYDKILWLVGPAEEKYRYATRRSYRASTVF